MNGSATSSKRNKLYWAAVFLFLIVGIVALAFNFLSSQSQAQGSRTAPGNGSRWAYVETPEQLQEGLDRTKEIREKLKPWAEKNRVLLSRMRQSDGNDQATLQAVLDSLPYAPNYEGTNFTFRDLLHSGPVEFTSRTGGKRMQLTDADKRNKLTVGRHAAGLRFQQRMIDDFYKQYKDVALFATMTQGPKYYTLWVSGRITQTTQDLIVQPGEEPHLIADQTEVVPPFDFVTPNL